MHSSAYAAVQSRLATGWNTFNTFSVLSHVWMPEAIGLQLILKDYSSNDMLHEAFIGQRKAEAEQIRPGVRTWDNSYTDLHITWRNLELRVQTATDGDDLLMVIDPIKNPVRPGAVALSAGTLWGRPGKAWRESDRLCIETPGRHLEVHCTRTPADDPYFRLAGPYIVATLDAPVGYCTGKRRTLETLRERIEAQRVARERAVAAKFGTLSETFDAMQSVLAWNTVYEPLGGRVVSPVSRIWSARSRGGYVLFCWDTFFAASLAAIDNKEIAYANAVEIFAEVTEEGFVPNNSQATGRKSRDRSQPPVGSISILDLYERFGDRWLLEETFAPLLRWNRWWKRRLLDAPWGTLLAWGSHPFTPVVGDANESFQPNTHLGAVLETGLDNSPMYEAAEVPFDAQRHVMLLHDVGLNALYIADCRALAKIAGILGKSAEEAELTERAEGLAGTLEHLWSEPAGLYLNRRTDTGEFSKRLSPTLLYPLIGGTAPADRADRMIRALLENPQVLGGDWLLPSIARYDPAFVDMDYWRGPVWGPLNWLVYLGLRCYRTPTAVAGLRAVVENSNALLLKGWREHRHVYENYHAVTGDGYHHKNADPFYHWGALLGLMALREAGKA